MYVWTRKNWLNFRSHSPPDPDPGIFWRILRHCEIGHLSTIWLISPERVVESPWKFYHRCTLRQRSSCQILEVNWIQRPDPVSVSGYGLRIQTIFSLADVCGLWLLLFYLMEWITSIEKVGLHNVHFTSLTARAQPAKNNVRFTMKNYQKLWLAKTIDTRRPVAVESEHLEAVWIRWVNNDFVKEPSCSSLRTIMTDNDAINIIKVYSIHREEIHLSHDTPSVSLKFNIYLSTFIVIIHFICHHIVNATITRLDTVSKLILALYNT